MSKVSIGLRGWRFDEDEVFTAEGEYRPFDRMDADVRNRLIRLSVVVGEHCDACWLGREDPGERNRVGYVYGEPMAEVLVCDDHEPDFVYWFREAGGSEHAGESDFDDRFHEWFADGNRAPDRYGGMEYVEAEAAELPDPPTPDPDYLEGHIAEGAPEQRIDIVRGTIDDAPDEQNPRHGDRIELDEDLDLSTDYPT
jgi:hypothetical protein